MKKNYILFLILLFSYLGFSQIRKQSTTIKINAALQKVTLLKNQNKFDAAFTELKKAILFSEKNRDNKSLIDCYNEYALLYLETENQKNASFFLDRAKYILKKTEYPYGFGKVKSIEALIFIKNQKYNQARALLYEAKQQSNNRNLLHFILLYEGYIYTAQKNYPDAKTNFNALVANQDPKDQKNFKTKGYINLAKINLLENEINEAKENSKLAYDMATSNNYIQKRLESSKLLSDSYELLKKYESALFYTKENKRLYDSINAPEKTRIREELIYTQHVNSLQEQIKKQDKTIDQLSQSEDRFKTVSLLTSGFLIIISLLAISLYRTNQIKISTNDLLVRKNKELVIAKDEAERAMKAKTQFLSTVSHELRTPLYAVTGLTHLLLEENPTENQKEHLKSLKFSGDYLLGFINDILQINKIEANKLLTDKVAFSIQKVLSEVILSLQQTAKENDTKVFLEIDKTIPKILISDPIKISQIFINLVGNAIKFTHGGKVTILAKLLEIDESNSKIFFEIADTGIGISKEMQENIFESFEQGSIQINRKYGGTGLGLTIVKSILNLFGSEIQLKSTLGIGSSFFFDIDFENIKENQGQEIKKLKLKNLPLDGLHMLLVEDNKINQVITKKMLLKKGITSDIANNGYEAINMVKQKEYDGILMDIHMPGISGTITTEEIRKFNTKIPIIALTAISLDDSTEHFYLAGCNDVITKPFKPEVFYQKIAENLLTGMGKSLTSES